MNRDLGTGKIYYPVNRSIDTQPYRTRAVKNPSRHVVAREKATLHHSFSYYGRTRVHSAWCDDLCCFVFGTNRPPRPLIKLGARAPAVQCYVLQLYVLVYPCVYRSIVLIIVRGFRVVPGRLLEREWRLRQGHLVRYGSKNRLVQYWRTYRFRVVCDFASKMVFSEVPVYKPNQFLSTWYLI
jgi:hypothetical protein